MSLPELSIVIAAQGSAEETRRCIESLAKQTDINPDQIEFIVEGNSPGVDGGAPAHARSLPMLHGTGMQKARAALIAITEAHCTFPPTWGATAIKLHACHPACAIGGMVLPGPHLNGMNFALFLCDYIQFLPPVESASSADLPGNNIVFKKECLPAGLDLTASGFWKTFHCHELESKGQDLRIEPTLSIFYNRNLTLTEIMARRYHHGRCFGGMRAQSSSLVKRAILFAAGFALPILLLAKLLSRASKKTDGLKLVFRHLGWIWLFLTIWAYGEWIGNLLGSGNSCDQL